jgi:hypothetical protein
VAVIAALLRHGQQQIRLFFEMGPRFIGEGLEF